MMKTGGKPSPGFREDRLMTDDDIYEVCRAAYEASCAAAGAIYQQPSQSDSGF